MNTIFDIQISGEGRDLVISDVDGCLTDGQVLYFDNGKRARFFSVLDGHGVELLRNNGFVVIFISGESDQCIKERADKLSVTFYGNIKNKGDFVKSAAQSYASQAIYYLGDDVSDLSVLSFFSENLSFFTPKSSIITELNLDLPISVLSKKGGYGAFREFAHAILLSNKITLGE